MELDAELQRRNKEIFAIEQERGNLEIELAECNGVFKQKQRKELQERIALLDKKVAKMKTELSKVLRMPDMLMLRNSLQNFLLCVRRSRGMKRLVRNGRRSVLRRRLKRRRMVSIMEMFRHLKEEEHVSFRGITKFGNPLLFYSKNNCNGKRKTEEIRWIICYDIQCRYIGFIKPNNGENNYEYGESMKKLVILRGNSGSGKTTVARALQRKIGFNTMLILLGVGGIIQPTTSALLHNTSTLLIGWKSMNDLL